MFPIYSFSGEYLQIQLQWFLFLLLGAFQVGFLFGKNHKYKQQHYQQQKLIPIQKEVTNTQFLSLQSKQQHKIQKQTKQNTQEQFLKEKIALQGKKIQTKGLFEMRVQRNQTGKYLRKIQKHQIITDYQYLSENMPTNQKLTDPNSFLEITLYQNYSQNCSPLIQKKIINLSEFHQYSEFSRTFCQNGKFRKFFLQPKIIGSGGFGTVFQATSVIENKLYAIKKIFIKDHRKKSQLMKQVKIISNFSHQNIVRFYSCWVQQVQINQNIKINGDSIGKSSKGSKLKSESHRYLKNNEISYISSNSDFMFAEASDQIQSIKENSKNFNCVDKFTEKSQKMDNFSVYALYIQMQLCQGGNLAHYLHHRRSISAKLAFHVIDQIMNGVQYLHSCGIAHRDLKPANIFFDQKQRKIKIGDFGLATLITKNSENITTFQKNIKGTPSYIAPEILKKIPIADIRLVDIYAIGVIYYQLLNSFQTLHQRVQKLNRLKDNDIIGLEQYILERKIIKMMTKRNRLPIGQLRKKKQFIELKKIYASNLDQ